jgi:hypothetical protein
VGTAAAITQQCAENGLNLILEAPPRQGKSENELVHSPAIHLTKNPNFRYLAITHSQDLANKLVTAAGRIVAEEGFRLKTEKANSFKIDGSVRSMPATIDSESKARSADAERTGSFWMTS